MNTPPTPSNAAATGQREDALAVLARLREGGHVAYFAGGCVRDLLLGLEPEDYDVATDAPPERVRQLFPSTQAVGAAFGVILVRRRGSVIEVATFRTDGHYADGRRPAQVHFATAEQDAQRRDFTINGLFFDPIENRVIDYVGGRDDLAARRLRAIGDPAARFGEDHLRLLRAVRFAARFGLDIDALTGTAIAAHASKLRRISPERVGDELRLMLTPVTRGAAWQMLWQFGLVAEIFRFQSPQSMNPPGAAAMLFPTIARDRPINFSVALAGAALCYRWRTSAPSIDVRELLSSASTREATRCLRQALRTSNAEDEQIGEMMESLAALLADSFPSVARLKRFLATPTSGGARALLAALAGVGAHCDRAAAVESALSTLEKTDFAPAPLISGDDLTAAGLRPGRAFKLLLDQTYDAQLEQKVATREAALEMALRLAAERPVNSGVPPANE